MNAELATVPLAEQRPICPTAGTGASTRRAWISKLVAVVLAHDNNGWVARNLDAYLEAIEGLTMKPEYEGVALRFVTMNELVDVAESMPAL